MFMGALKFYKITYFLADLQPHHFDVYIVCVSTSLFNLFAQVL